MKATVKIIKSNKKSNITCSVSKYEDGTFRSFNLTGSLTGLEGFVSREGVNYSEELVGLNVGTTLIIANEAAGQAIYERCGEIFAARAEAGDKNPAVELLVECNTVNPTSTNILISNITRAFVNKEATVSPSSESILDSLAALKEFSAAKTTIMTNSVNNNLPAVKAQISSARSGLNSLISNAKKSIISHK